MSDENVQKLLIYVLNGCSTKMPIKKSDLVEIVGKDQKAFNICLTQLESILHNVYGITMVEVPETKTGKKYICYAENSASSPIEYNTKQQAEMTLLYLVLSYMFMTKTKPSETDLENYLKLLKIEFDCEHTYFGSNVKKLITDTFVKQLYLKKLKNPSEFDNDDKFLYDWGYRATLEFNKNDVLKLVGELVDVPIENFIEQYRAATGADTDGEMETESV